MYGRIKILSSITNNWNPVKKNGNIQSKLWAESPLIPTNKSYKWKTSQNAAMIKKKNISNKNKVQEQREIEDKKYRYKIRKNYYKNSKVK